MFDFSSAEEKRIQRALSKDMTPASLDNESKTAIFLGSSGDLYNTTLEECTCTDFKVNLQSTFPCKHILRLGMELGIYPAENIKTDKQGVEHRYWEIKAANYVRHALITDAMDFVYILSFATTKEGLTLPEKHSYSDNTVQLLLSCPYLTRRSNGSIRIKQKILSQCETLLSNRIGKLALNALDFQPLRNILEAWDSEPISLEKFAEIVKKKQLKPPQLSPERTQNPPTPLG